MTYQEIEQLQLEDLIVEVLSSMLDLSSVPLGVNFYEYSNDENLSLYERITLHTSLVKPSLGDVTDAFNVLKQKMLDEYEPKKLARERIAALSDKRKLMDRNGYSNIPNTKAFFNQIIKDAPAGTPILDVLEADNAAVAQEVAIDAQLDVDIKDGKKKAIACDDCLNAIRGYNSSTEMSRQDIRNQKTTFADLYEALTDKSPTLARADIEAVNNAEYAGLKIGLLRILERHGF